MNFNRLFKILSKAVESINSSDRKTNSITFDSKGNLTENGRMIINIKRKSNQEILTYDELNS